MDLPLRVGVAVYCLGTGIAALVYQPPAFSLLFIEMDWSSSATQTTVEVFSWALIASTLVLVTRRATPLCGVATFWVLIEIITRLISRQRFDELAPYTMSLRLVAPIAVILVSHNKTTIAAWALRLAACATFAGHGVQAIQENPIFIDYMLAATMVLGVDVSETAAKEALFVIGILDILAAALLLLRPLRVVLYYMIIWGLITAFARPVHSGWIGTSDCLVRLIHSAAPLAILLHYHYTKVSNQSRAR